MRKFIPYIIVLTSFGVFIQCSVEQDPTPNPFGDSNPDMNASDTVSPVTIQGLHKYIFATKCANPTCHDGSFEPDFRTVESSYQTLVYHPVVKNDEDESYDYRVVPMDHQASWLYERLTTTDDVNGRMPLYANPLSSEELGWVIQWIDDGARDVNGVPTKFPNQVPSVEGFILVNSIGDRIDTARVDGQLSPMLLPNNEAVTMYIAVEDDSTALGDLQINTGKFAYDEFDFSNALSKIASPIGNIAYSLSFNTNEFVQGDTVYFRYYVQDTDNPTIVEFPNDQSPFYFRIIASFVVQ